MSFLISKQVILCFILMYPTFSFVQITFSDSTTNFYVKVYFAKHFAKLRETFFVSGEEMYIRSLARCISWSARGGKSGSNFCKTKGNSMLICL